MHVNDRAQKFINYNKKILKNFEYVEDIVFFNGNKGNAWDVINHKGIKTDSWSPYDGRLFPILPGELGVWLSTINVWEYIVNNKIDKFLVLEDDIILASDFVENLDKCLLDTPEDFDFLSLYYFKGQNDFEERTDIGSQYIHRALNQHSAAQATVYSRAGAKKLLKLTKIKGLEYTSDCFIFKQSHLDLVNGYSIIPGYLEFLKHDFVNIKSIIDPDNLRKTQTHE